MSKAIIAVIALIMMILCISSVTGQSVSYGYDQYGRITCLIYNYGNIRYLNYGNGIGHWEVWDGNFWQYYFPNSNNYGSTPYSGRSSSSSGHDYYAEQLEKNNKIYANLAESQKHMNDEQSNGGWIPTGTLLPTPF
jgi:hypothetical protein